MVLVVKRTNDDDNPQLAQRLELIARYGWPRQWVRSLAEDDTGKIKCPNCGNAKIGEVS
jgi:hypothetical protein